jgi:hypothetical protein
VSKGRASTLCSAAMRRDLSACNKKEGRAVWPAPLEGNSIESAAYQLPPVGQPPVAAVPHERVVTPLASFVIVNVLFDFDFAVTV